ncbi:MAG: TolC family protein [Thermodesulfobacteriota bacterium]
MNYSLKLILSGVIQFTIAAVFASLIMACAGRPVPVEKTIRSDFSAVASRYRPGDAKPDLPVLSTRSGIDDYLRFAILNNPAVEAAYYEWAASVEQISVARSLPDPRLTFQADIADMISSLMAGLMLDLPGPGKLRAAGEAAAAESRVRYAAFEAEVLRIAFAVKSAYYRLAFLEENIHVQRDTLKLLDDLEQLARQQNAAGRAMLQDVLRAQIEQEQLRTRIENLEDSRGMLLAEFKAALGLGPGDSIPPTPSVFTLSGETPDSEGILETALRQNPAIQQMAADIKRAQAMLDLARKAGVPDFSIGLEVDVKPDPVMWRPSAGISLPVWRDRIAAEIAAAQAGKRAAEARLDGEQVRIAAELAAMLYMHRESVRNADLLENRLIPKGRQSLEAARAGYASGRSAFFDVIESHRQLLMFDTALIEARTQRELSLANLSLLIAGTPPPGDPLQHSEENSDHQNTKEDSR